MRMLPVLIVALLLLFAFPVHAQSPVPEKSLPDAPQPKPFNKKIFWTGVSLLAASNVADMKTTDSVLHGGGVEYDPLFGTHPSRARLWGESTAFFAAGSVGFYFSEHSRHRWIRWTGRAVMVTAIELHIQMAYQNSTLWRYRTHR
jgi:hypothetical protein